MTKWNEIPGGKDPIDNLLDTGIAAVEDARRAEEFASAACQVREDLREGRITVEQGRQEFMAAFEQLITDLV
jgi:hypothetical protein